MSDGATPLSRAERALVDAVRTALGDQAGVRAAADGEHRIVLHEERLLVGRRTVPDGEVTIRKVVDVVPVTTPLELGHEEVVIERLPGTDDSPRETVVTDGEIRIPILEERLVVEKRLVVREVVVVRRERVVRTEAVHETVRRERLVVEGEEVADDGTAPAMPDDPAVRPAPHRDTRR